MPTYSYACTQCDNRFDVVQSFTDDALTVCNECSGKLRKLFNSVGIVFKGSGFYRNDSRSGKNGSSMTAEAKSEGTADSGNGSKKSESSSTSTSKASSPAAVAS